MTIANTVWPQARSPGGTLNGDRVKLPGASGHGEHLFPQGRGGVGGGRYREPGRCLAQPADLSHTRRAAVQVTLEPFPFRTFHRVQDVTAGEDLQLMVLEHHPVHLQAVAQLSQIRLSGTRPSGYLPVQQPMMSEATS
jgi:hypothetical protein